MSHWSDFVKRAFAQSQQREREELVQWLKSGGQAEPDRSTNEGRAAWAGLHDLHEFCRWVKSRNASIVEAMPFGLVAADGMEERHWKPVGGLDVEHWPYLKACCGPDDEEFSEICRNEIVDAMLTNELQKKGHSFGVAGYAVDRLVAQCGEFAGRPLWLAVEALSFADVVSHLHEEALRIGEELLEQRQRREKESSPHDDWLDETTRTFMHRGKPSRRFSSNEYRLFSVLWRATDHSSPLEDVAAKVWGARPASIEDRHAHYVRELGRRTAEKIGCIEISVTRDRYRTGRHYRVTLTFLQ